VIIMNDQIEDLARVFWDPSIELGWD
jgi:hypothetical protein